MDRSPPSFFNQGPSAHARLAFFAALAIVLLIVDSRLGSLEPLRQGVGTMLYPLQRSLLVPRELLAKTVAHVSSVETLRAENTELRRIEVANARALLQAQQLVSENAQLRELLGARERAAVRSIVAEVLYESRDPYSRKVVIDRGLQHGLLAGQPVIDAHGVIGQVTRSLPLSSEVTLLTDRKSAIPVRVVRTGQRMIAFGGAEPGMLELRFLSGSTDLREGDDLVTSGLDGVYPAGIPVGTALNVKTGSLGASSARVTVRPAAAMSTSRMALVLLIDRTALPAAAIPEPQTPPRRRRAGPD
jgi:rod shape-determining protein MreC